MCPGEEFRHLFCFSGCTCATEHLSSLYYFLVSLSGVQESSGNFSPASWVTHALLKICKALENRYGEIVILASFLDYNSCILKPA